MTKSKKKGKKEKMKTSLRKYLSFMMVLFVGFICLFVGVSVKAATVVESVDFTTKLAKHSSYTDSWTYDGWTVSGGANNNGGWAYVKMGGKKDNLAKYNDIYIASPLVAGQTSKVTVNVVSGSGATSSRKATMGVYVYSDSSYSNQIDYIGEKEVKSTAELFEFEPTNGVSWPANSYFKVVFTCTNTTTTNGIVWLDNVSIYDYDEAAASQPSIEIAGENFTEVDDVIELEASTSNTTGTVVWSSSDTAVATVDQNGNVTANSFGKTTITASVDGVEDTLEFTVYPTDGSELTIAEALLVCEYTGTTNCAFTYSTTGVIESIDTAYDSNYGNITVTITDGTDSITAYRMIGGEELVVGDKIKVTGTLINYGGNTPEFTQGCTYVEVGEDPTITAAKEALALIGAYISLAYKYTRDQKEVVAVASSVIMSHSVETSTNLTADVNNAAIVGLDETLFNVTTAKNKASNEVGLNKDGTIRLYANAASQSGTSLTIATLNDQKIASIEVVFGGTCGDITVNGEAATAGANGTYTYQVDATSVTIQNVTATNVQVWMKSITINLASSDEVTYTDVFTNAEFRMRFGVDAAIANIENVDSYGVVVTANGKSVEYSNVEIEGNMAYVVISLGDLFENEQRFSIEFTAQAFIVIDGITYLSENTKTHSVASMIAEYNKMDLGEQQGNVTHLYNILLNKEIIVEVE